MSLSVGAARSGVSITVHSSIEGVEGRFAAWVATQLPDVGTITVDRVDREALGHSSETLVVTLRLDGRPLDVVLRLRPPSPGLLEPYDLDRQFRILRALEGSPVRAPKVLWYEATGDVLGREFYVMERLPGTVYERRGRDGLDEDPVRVRRMCESMIEQMAAIHTVGLQEHGLAFLGDGRDYLEREMAHWSAEIERVRRGPLPGLDRLVTELRLQKPAQCPVVTLVHGDAKPGNFAFVGSEVQGVFDWEMTSVGDPLADIGWAEMLWRTPNALTALPGALSPDEFVAYWEQLTGIAAQHRSWYRAFQSLKMAVILLVGGSLFDRGLVDDPRFLEMTRAIPPTTSRALADLGVTEELDSGLVSSVVEGARGPAPSS